MNHLLVTLVLLCNVGIPAVLALAINYGPWAVAIISALVLLTWFVTRWMRSVKAHDSLMSRLISEIKP